jgi:hypothetical protein
LIELVWYQTEHAYNNLITDIDIEPRNYKTNNFVNNPTQLLLPLKEQIDDDHENINEIKRINDTFLSERYLIFTNN